MEKFEEYTPKIIGILTVLFPNAKIILFGSRARGTNQRLSDVDIAIDESREIDRLRMLEAKDVLEALNLLLDFDIVDFNAISKTMQEIISKEGIIWKQQTT